MAVVRGSTNNDFVQIEDGGGAVPDGYIDVPEATNQNDRIFVFDGDDIVRAGAGDDSIEGGVDNDSLFGQAGDDTIYGEEGSDSLDGGRGDDYLDGSARVLINPDALDTLRGGAGADTLLGGNFGDLFTGGAGPDRFVADEWTRRQIGQEDLSLRDIITDFDPSEGDQLDLSTTQISDVDTLRAITSVEGNNTVIGYYAGAELQEIVLRGITDFDAIADAVIFNTDTADRGFNFRYFQSEGFAPSDDRSTHFFGGEGDDEFLGGSALDSVGLFNDYMFGGLGDDTFDARAGDDFLRGGAGADELDGGAGTDVADYSTSQKRVVVDLTKGTGRKGDAEGDVLISIEQVDGSSRNDVLIGASENEVLNGGDGNDRLEGRKGADILTAGAGDDLLKGGNGRDNLLGGSGDDSLEGGGGADLITSGESGQDLLLGGAGRDTLVADAGGDATLTGGGGADRFVFVHENSATVTDFNVEKEVVAIDPSLESESRGFRNFIRNSDQVGDDVVYDKFDDGLAVIILQDVDLSDLSAENFDFG